jgi:thiol-disulfide isomerase/thioredoxin
MKNVRLLAACLLVLGLVALCLTGPLVTSAKAQGATIVEFRNPLWPFCIQMTQVLGEIQSKYGGQISVMYYNTDTDQPMFDKYNVSVVPTLLIMGPSGSVMYRHEGVMSKDELVSTLKSMNLIHDWYGFSFLLTAYSQIKGGIMKTMPLMAACLLVLGLVAGCHTGPMATPANPQGATILEFRSSMWPFCAQMAQVLGEIQSKYPGQISVTYYDNSTEQRMFDKYDVSLVPTLIILGPSGGVMYRHEGALSKNELISTFKSMNLIHDWYGFSFLLTV